ncbi:AraC family transcriptional regulator [Myroides sp. TSA_177.3]|uniref:AraC family transcriptional regulator n=1 Tax=Myroides sp. TSA_177.3 TaxID=3415650 RepID=UPI00404537D8
MALFITLDNVRTLYPMEATPTMEGIVVHRQQHQPHQSYSRHNRLFDGLLLGFMLKGTMKLNIHFSTYEIKAGDIAVIPPQIMLETLDLDEEAELVTIGLSLDFITEFPLLREWIMNDQIRWQPIVQLKPEEQVLQKELVALIQRFYHKEPSANKVEMLRHLILVLIHMLVEVYSAIPIAKRVVKNRTHAIIDAFYALLMEHAIEQRQVGFYAEQLHLTPQYLSTFLKQHTGKSVSQWVDHQLVLQAKMLLSASDQSIKEISHHLHFIESSVFSRFFKRMTGISPSSFREQRGVAPP